MAAWSRLAEEVVELALSDWLTAWRMRFNIPLGDPRLEVITFEQARFDVMLHDRVNNPQATQARERDKWFEEVKNLPLPDTAPLRQTEPAFASTPGNWDKEAALERLAAIKAKSRTPWDPDGTYTVESLSG